MHSCSKWLRYSYIYTNVVVPVEAFLKAYSKYLLYSTPTSTTKATFCMRYYKYYFLFWLLLKCLLYKNCMIMNHFDFWYDGMIFKESTIFLWREKKEKKFYGLWSMARVVKRTTFLWILSKGPFWREIYILCYHHHNIKANCNLHRAIFHLLYTYIHTYISNKLGMFFWLVWTVSTRFCGLCFWQAMMVNDFL